MTSSLVGSEMCIRDSIIPCQQMDPPEFETKQVMALTGLVGADRIAIWTVSYTHLTLPTICSV
eukprot:9924631-Prorocentrum_lima.AAC.1